MNFKKEVEEKIIYEWKDKFISYDKLIKVIKDKNLFKKVLLYEINKISKFYDEKELNFSKRQGLLHEQLYKLVKKIILLIFIIIIIIK
jgi:SPX domain protein involved in polyphosphate accumulation